ncbi:SDR family oxidoreductase [Thalassobaculum sp. OXR-137]|uniref:SDR family NAD(P)-dependent oxidoreductase n=1 Tax=Thalassobaculum sp. OXR-137 TaxID=3100173 RepID=UPI002AC97000|nr:SDR family oxidoreductase [Thalassobaculum sp. OXR-137]WPZ34555.1 SDR family oxidoreductase [Thalassobaculum sp. OXR-137]
MARFDDKAVLVTGAASGIGAAVALMFAKENARLALIDKPGSPIPEEIGRQSSAIIPCDLGDPVAAENAVSRCQAALGGIDIVSYNAGFPVQGPRSDITPDEWRAHFDADVHGIYFLIRAARAALMAARGCVVNTTSIAALGGDPGMPAYDAAKGAALQLTNSLALELGPHGVRVNSVCPTLIKSPNAEPVERDAELYERVTGSIPLRRIGEPEEVAAAVLWLAGPEASYINGVALPVDGGLSASNGQPDMRNHHRQGPN